MPDIMICDLDNNEKELGVIKRLNENSSTECIPLLVITSTPNNAHIRAAMELGADDVLVKPINYESLLRSIKKDYGKLK
ncbi:MAG: response regulator [Ignavibacteriales bacterium]|nr:response regulator [Ignavibacteriales bacterium]